MTYLNHPHAIDGTMEYHEDGCECEECCEHEELEDFHCLQCGKDRTEDIMSHAYDRVKDIMKYGE